MPIDTSIYQNIRPTQVEAPNMLDSAQKAMTLSQMGMQQAQMQRQMQQQQALQQAYSQNTDPNTGMVNKQGLGSTLSKLGWGQLAAEHVGAISKMEKEAADAKAAQADAAGKMYSVTGPAFDYMAKLPDADRAKVYPNIIQQLKDQGVDVSKMDHPYDPKLFDQYYGAWQQSKPHLENILTAANADKSSAEADKLRSETYKRNPNIANVTDPAQLVPGQVPKEHQAKAFGEIDAAENTKKMAGNIMDSFEQAVNDTRGLGRASSLFKDPRSTMALHQALQPTFKDLEGTVRQAAMDNTFNNITPKWNDTAADIATKREALQNYLQSKASAPTARGYGIDLAKYDSTSAYQPKPKASSAGGSQGGNTAYAAEMPKHGAVEGGYVYMGGDPGNPKSWKKASK